MYSSLYVVPFIIGWISADRIVSASLFFLDDAIPFRFLLIPIAQDVFCGRHIKWPVRAGAAHTDTYILFFAHFEFCSFRVSHHLTAFLQHFSRTL